MTALEIVLFVTPRVFLFVAGPVRIQKIRAKPKVRHHVVAMHRALCHNSSGHVNHIPYICEAEAPGQRAAGAVSRHAVGCALCRRCHRVASRVAYTPRVRCAQHVKYRASMPPLTQPLLQVLHSPPYSPRCGWSTL
jgi:hypothetical protein